MIPAACPPARLAVLALLSFRLVAPSPAASQSLSAANDAADAAPVVPAPPLPPAVIARDPEGRVTVRATRLDQPLVLDGRLDEEVYASVLPFGDLIQADPQEGQPATDKTDIWVFYDSRNVYVSLRVWSTRPETIIANEMRRDGQAIWTTNDNIGVSLDTFHDHRSGYYLETNAVGGLRDALLTDEERNASIDFNLVWDVRSRRFEQGWMTEMVIPFKSLRYPKGREQVWGFQIQRLDRSKNEVSHLTPIPASYALQGSWRMSAAATLVGIEAPSGGSNFELKPYALSSVASDLQATPALSNDLNATVGFDARYKITRGLNADFTYNTDFAQVEVDNQQVNLSRFSLFYPEKRDFFLEAQTIFNFGGTSATMTNAPILFFSRRIGLTADGTPGADRGRRQAPRKRRPVHDRGDEHQHQGAGKAEAPATTFTPATTFSIVRVRRNVLRRSAIGMIATDREPSTAGAGSNRVFGLDASLGLFQNVNAIAYYARSQTTGRSGDDESYRGQFRYLGDRYGAEFDRVKAGPAFNPEIGFLARTNYVRHYVFGRFSPRPKRPRGVRKFSWEASLENFTSPTGVAQTNILTGIFRDLPEQRRRVRPPPRPDRGSAAVGIPHSRRRDRARFVRLRYDHGQLHPRSAAPAHRNSVDELRGLLRWTENRDQLHRTHIGHFAAHRGAHRHPRLAEDAGRRFQLSSRERKNHLHHDAADVRGGLDSVQLERQSARDQHPIPLGVSARQRFLRGLQRRTRHAGARVSGVRQPQLHDQVHASAPKLSRRWPHPPEEIRCHVMISRRRPASSSPSAARTRCSGCARSR